MSLIENAVPEVRPILPATTKHYIEQLKKNGQWYGKPLVDEKISAQIIKLVDADIVREYQVVPVGIENDDLVLVTSLIKTMKSADKLMELLQRGIKLQLDTLENVASGIQFYYDVSPIVRYTEFEALTEEDSNQEDTGDPYEYSAIIAKVDDMIANALKSRASDIHIHPHENGSFVLFRIDGRLINFSAEHVIERKDKKAVVNVIKNRCTPAMNISNHLMPEGGTFKIPWSGRIVDFRVSTMPTIRGQKVVIRVLNTKRVALDLNKLGFTPEERRLMDSALLRTSGFFIVSGPTGSGKSTTLHAILKRFNGLENNTITIENPVEYKDETITQTQVREADSDKTTLDSKTIFKTTLRQDPDNVYYGEVRDEEDAKIAIEAAQTGHRVLTTVHADDVPTTLDRLFDLDIKRSSLLSKLNCIMSQRLVMQLCPHCSIPGELSEDDTMMLSEAERADLESGTLKKAGPGCKECFHGYLGRSVVAEFVVFDNALRDFLRHDRGICEILEELRNTKGFQTMWDKGLAMVKQGRVNFSDLLRAITPNN